MAALNPNGGLFLHLLFATYFHPLGLSASNFNAGWPPMIRTRQSSGLNLWSLLTAACSTWGKTKYDECCTSKSNSEWQPVAFCSPQQYYLSVQTSQVFIWDTCRHLTICLRIMETHWMRFSSMSYINSTSIKNKSFLHFSKFQSRMFFENFHVDLIFPLSSSFCTSSEWLHFILDWTLKSSVRRRFEAIWGSWLQFLDGVRLSNITALLLSSWAFYRAPHYLSQFWAGLE